MDAHINTVGGLALARDLGLPPSFCPEPEYAYNPIRIGYVQSALLKALERWIETGAPPPASRFLELQAAGNRAELSRDVDGNALGGLRPPQTTKLILSIAPLLNSKILGT